MVISAWVIYLVAVKKRNGHKREFSRCLSRLDEYTWKDMQCGGGGDHAKCVMHWEKTANQTMVTVRGGEGGWNGWWASAINSGASFKQVRKAKKGSPGRSEILVGRH